MVVAISCGDIVCGGVVCSGSFGGAGRLADCWSDEDVVPGAAAGAASCDAFVSLPTPAPGVMGPLVTSEIGTVLCGVGASGIADCAEAGTAKISPKPNPATTAAMFQPDFTGL